ncbi:MAG: glycosyltransferase, partial [Intrasporangiaceae bacterium]|nr:glycosyltransferase [Intrasporangiaceae bacterium]
LQEAAATGLPVVAPAVGGPLDLVEHAVTGYLFDPLRRGALSACVGHLVSAPRESTAMGAAGRRTVEGRSWAVLTDQLLVHYRTARERAYGLATPA